MYYSVPQSSLVYDLLKMEFWSCQYSTQNPRLLLIFPKTIQSSYVPLFMICLPLSPSMNISLLSLSPSHYTTIAPWVFIQNFREPKTIRSYKICNSFSLGYSISFKSAERSSQWGPVYGPTGSWWFLCFPPQIISFTLIILIYRGDNPV